MPAHQHDRTRGLPLPLRITADGRVVLCWPEPKLHSLVFGFNLVALARIALAKLGDQTSLELITCYTGVVPVALTFGVLASKRMKERAPRLYASTLAFAAMALYALPGTIPTIMPSMTSNLAAVGTMVALAVGTGLAECLHRLSGRAEALT